MYSTRGRIQDVAREGAKLTARYVVYNIYMVAYYRDLSVDIFSDEAA